MVRLYGVIVGRASMGLDSTPRSAECLGNSGGLMGSFAGGGGILRRLWPTIFGCEVDVLPPRGRNMGNRFRERRLSPPSGVDPTVAGFHSPPSRVPGSVAGSASRSRHGIGAVGAPSSYRP